MATEKAEDMQDYNAPPLNPLPWVVWLLALPMMAMELVVSMAEAGFVGGVEGAGWRVQALTMFAFSPDMLRKMVELGTYPPEHLYRILTFPFVHGNTMHAVFVVVMLLALGKAVGSIFRWWAVIVIFFGAAVVGAVVYSMTLPNQHAALFGGYPAVYGLIGGFTFLLWVGLAATGANRFRAFGLIGFLLAAQLLFGLLFGGGQEWVADLSGFAFGFLASFVVSPGGYSRVLAKIRTR